MITVGLTGGIASGKSVVAEILRECGAYIIDTDVLSRRVVEKGSAGAAALEKRFPSAFDRGVLDRRALKNIVFGDKKALADLNAVTHPLIERAVDDALAKCDADVAVVVAPLLFEAGLDKKVDMTVNVTADENVRIRRLIARDTITEELARAILDSQMEEAERCRRADVVVDNNGDVKKLRDEVKILYNQIAERA